MEGGNLLSEEGLEVELQILNTGQDDLVENFADCAKPQGFHGESLQATRTKTVLKLSRKDVMVLDMQVDPEEYPVTLVRIRIKLD